MYCTLHHDLCVFTDVPAPWIVLEYLCNGDLKSFLSKNKRPLTKLVKYMVDVSMGMHYISERGLVHRVSYLGSLHHMEVNFPFNVTSLSLKTVYHTVVV